MRNGSRSAMVLMWVIVTACALLYPFMSDYGLAWPIVVLAGVAVYGALTVPASRRFEQARRLAQSAAELTDAGRSAEAMDVWDALVTSFAESRDGAVRVMVASALFNKGHELSRLDRDEEALAAFDELIERFGDDRETEMIGLLTQARVNRGASLTTLNRHDEALAEFQGVVRDLAEPRSPRMREVDARATAGIVLSLLRAGRYDDAILAADDGISRSGGVSELGSELEIATLPLLKAEALGGLGKHEDELAVYAEFIDRYGGTVDPQMSLLVAQALASRGSILLRLGRVDESCAAQDQAFEWFSDRILDPPDVPMVELAAQAMASKGLALFEHGRLDEALAAYNRALTRLGDPPDPALLRRRSSILNNKGAALGRLRRWDEALAAYEEALAIRQEVGERSAHTVALVLVNKAEALASLGRCGEAVALCDEVGGLLAGVEHPTARRVLEEATRIRKMCGPSRTRRRSGAQRPSSSAR